MWVAWGGKREQILNIETNPGQTLGSIGILYRDFGGCRHEGGSLKEQ